VQLRASSGLDHRLATPYAPLAFPGDVALDCTLLGGTSTDFNLMTRRGVLRAGLQVLRDATNLPIKERGLLLALRGDWRLTGHGDRHGDSDTLDCAAGQGLWWDAAPHGWQVTPHNETNADGVTADAAAVLVWVRLDAFHG
jgi:environmental stress-induced protein Ves